MPKPLKLRTNDTIPDGIMICIWRSNLQKVVVAGRDIPDFADLRPGTVIWTNRTTKKKLDSAMAPSAPEPKQPTKLFDLPAWRALNDLEWRVLRDTYAGGLESDMTTDIAWPKLQSLGLVESEFGAITDEGRRAVESYHRAWNRGDIRDIVTERTTARH